MRAQQQPIDITWIENELLRIGIAPQAGGRITSIFNKAMGREFLWQATGLQHTVQPVGADYDSQFSGGIDELLPNDLPEKIDGIDYPDHGELWTTSLNLDVFEKSLLVACTLPKSGLYYSRRLSLEPNAAQIRLDYLLRNDSPVKKHFLWKLHAALPAKEGAIIGSSAVHARIVDPAYARYQETGAFNWPQAGEINVSQVPAPGNEMDFFYLYDTRQGEMSLSYPEEDALFAYTYDRQVFPYEWLFASYGGFLGHYTVILEPCTNMPISVPEAIARQQSAALEPGAQLETTVWIYAGTKSGYSLT